MSITISTLVEIDLNPVFALDTGLQATINDRIEAEVALQGWTLGDLDDQKSVYIAALVTKSYIPRLLLKFAQEVQRAKGGKAEAEFAKAIDYLKQLREECDDRIQRAAAEADPEDVLLDPVRWPGIGPVAWD